MKPLVPVLALLLCACPDPTNDSNAEVECDTDTNECGGDDDTQREPDTDCDTDAPLEPDVDVDTDTCIPEPVTDPTVDYVYADPEDHVAQSCSVPLSTCTTWSQAHQRSNYRCISSTELTGCAAHRRTFERSAEDQFWRFYDGAGRLISVRHESDYNLTCEQLPDDAGTAWTRWSGPRITGCTSGETRMSRRCLHETPDALPDVDRPVPASVPATLRAALTQLEGQCYGTVTCGCGETTGTVVVVAGHWSQQLEESLDHWFYDADGNVTASYVDDRPAGSAPLNCQDRTVVPSEACGFLPLGEPAASE